MKTEFNVTKLAAIVGLTLGMAAVAHAEVSMSADVELDTDVVSNAGGSADSNYNQGGRVKVGFSGKEETSLGFVQGVGQLLLNKDGSTGVDDAWVGFGQSQWGVKLGRFEALELFSKGPDTIHNVIGSTNFYQAGAARGRTSNTGQVLAYSTPTDKMHFELGTIWGQSAFTGDEKAFAGVRPAMQVDLNDNVRLAAGYEYLDDAGTKTKGFGLYGRYATDAFVIKANYADGKNETGSVTNWENRSFNINGEAGPFGLGYTRSEDKQTGGDKADTIYGRYIIKEFMGVKAASASLAFSAAKADSVTEDELAGRFRINYTF